MDEETLREFEARRAAARDAYFGYHEQSADDPELHRLKTEYRGAIDLVLLAKAALQAAQGEPNGR